VVPGVLILEQVVRMVEASTHSPVRLRGLTYAKFLAPLFPGELARIVVEAAGERLSFGVYRDGVLIAKGAYAVRDCDPS
jgi:3-hydroxymyristoyl/3-hydroxydecanoyl-(acyl carrier protein) dehydratase